MKIISMIRKIPWDSLDTMLDQLSGSNAGTIPKICHHGPREIRSGARKLKGAPKELAAFQARTYHDRTRGGIYIGGWGSWQRILVDHPEIRFLANVYDQMDNEICAFVRQIGADDSLTVRSFSIRDRDSRAPAKSSYIIYDDLPSEENVRPLVGFLKEWQAAGFPSLLTCCSAGLFRSPVTALAAHGMTTGDPTVSAIRMVMSGIFGHSHLDSNWEIARIADPMLGFGGRLHAAALNVQRATIERNRLLGEDATPGELLERLQEIFANPWDEEQALEYNKRHGQFSKSC